MEANTDRPSGLVIARDRGLWLRGGDVAESGRGGNHKKSCRTDAFFEDTMCRRPRRPTVQEYPNVEVFTAFA
ncbi:MAG: hypothetical protein ABFR89_05610, partial [Actinomycetota bacterium]